MKNKIDISIVMLTYQHLKYIEKALNSILMQKTKYEYEVIIVDDGSTDGTKEILRKFAKENSEKIHLFLKPNNTKKVTKNAYMAFMKARGKYIAILEGDDYWLDNRKLEKQIEYLEKHKEYSGVFHKCKIVDENDKPVHIRYQDLYFSKEGYLIKDFERGKLPGQAGTFMFRNIFKDSNGKYNFYYKLHNLVGDQILYCILLAEGKFGYIDEEMGAYRSVIKKGGTNACSISANNNYNFDMWKYYCQLEICMKKRIGIEVDLKVQKNNRILWAKCKLKEEKNLKNLYIYLRTVAFNTIWNVLRA